MADRLLRAAEVAERLGVSRWTANQLMASMPRVNLSINARSKRPRYAVRESDLERWKTSRTEMPAAPVRQTRERSRRQVASGAEPLYTLDADGTCHIKRRALKGG